MNALARARHRAAAIRRGDDAGFMLIYVLMVVGVIAAVVGGTLVVTTGSIVPTVQGTYNQAADAAAQAGLQSFIAFVDGKCNDATSSVSTCWTQKLRLSDPNAALTQTQSISTPGAAGSYSSTYTWIAKKDPSDGFFRVESVGVVKQNGLSATKIVVGDVIGGSSLNLLDYGIVTGFESQSSATVLRDWQARTIALDCAAVDAADFPLQKDKCTSPTDTTHLNSINWSGSSPGTAAGKVAVCNATFDQKGGRGNNVPPKAPNPYVDWTEAGLNGNTYTNFQPCQTNWGSLTKLVTAIGNGADGKGGYFSNDALLISNSWPGGPGPLFNQPVSTNWQYTSADAGICSLAPGQNYRSFNLQCAGYPIEVGGAPSSASTYPTVSVGQGPQIPSSDPTIPANACVYAGPTRVVLNGNSATVTSPQTTAAWVAANASSRPVQCYTGATGAGMGQSSVDLTGISVVVADDNGSVPKTTPASAHGNSGWPVTGQKLNQPDGSATTPTTSNSVFYASTPPAAAADTAAATAPDTCSATSTLTGATASANCQWSNASNTTAGPSWTADGTGWTKYSTGPSCPTDPTDKATFVCEYNGGTYTTGVYLGFRTAVKSSLAAASVSVANQGAGVSINGSTVACPTQTITPTTASAGQIACLLQDKLHIANTGQSQVSSSGQAVNDHRYVVTAGATTTTTTPLSPVGGVPAAPWTGDPLMTTTTGTASTETVTTKKTTFAVGRQVYKCYGVIAGGNCLLNPGGPQIGNQWGDGISTALTSAPQFQVTVTQSTYSAFVPGTSTITSFPSMADATQYQIGNSGTFGASGPGDLYVEGTASHTMALVAQDDVEVTGNLTGTVNPVTNRSTSALEIIGQNNVHVYHPVKCRITDPAAITLTDPAGYCPDDITGLYNSVLPTASRPDQQYVNLRPDLAGMTIRGVVMALGNAESHINCPQPPGGGGVCGGEFTLDNYNRGSALGSLNQIGTLAMAHHSPVGQEWEIPDTTGQTTRPYSGYEMAQQYENLKSLLAGVPSVDNILQTTTSTTALWHIRSISTGPGP